MKDKSDPSGLYGNHRAGVWNEAQRKETTQINNALKYWQDLACANRKVAEDNQTKLAAAQADAERWRQFLRNPYAAWDRIHDKLNVDSPAYWAKQANAGIDSFKECGK